MNDEISQATGRAHGKVILFGEHAVVHGTDALATALDRGVTVTAKRRPGPCVLETKPWGYTVDISAESTGARALQAIFRFLDLEPTGIALSAHADIPARSGLGASAALAAAATRALCALGGLSLTDEQLFNCVQSSEAVFHGNPSGIDAQLALFGGTILYNRERAPRRLAPLDMQLTVVHSGHPGDTSSTVRTFADKMRDEPEAAERLGAIQRIVTEATGALEAHDCTRLGALMDQNQAHLHWFEISTDDLNRICDIAKHNGAVGAKLTGGGGGGCAIVLESPGHQQAASALTKAGFQIIIP